MAESMPVPVAATIPTLSIEAIEGLDKLQTPPVAVSVKVREEPAHRVSVLAVMMPDTGWGSTKMALWAMPDPQALVTVKITVSKPPAIPESTPPVDIVALPLLVPQVPPDAESNSVVLEPAQTVSKPIIAPTVGKGARCRVVVTGVPQPVL